MASGRPFPEAPPSRGLRALSVTTAVGMFVVVVMGALVTQSGSAQGCGRSWPLCNGHVIPLALTMHALIEFGHRSVAGVVAVLTTAVAVWAWVRFRRSDVRALAAVGFGFVVVQALIGAAAVLWPESPPVLALHLGFALLALSGVGLLAVVLHQLSAQPPPGLSPSGATGWTWRTVAVPRAYATLAWATLVYIYGLVYLGAYVAHTGAGLACRGWPLCDGAVVPPLQGLVGISFGHRVAALLAAVLIAWLYAWSRRLRQRRPDLCAGSLASLGLVLVQAGTGALIVFTHGSEGAVLLHTTLASLLFGAVSYLCLQVLPEPAPHGAAREGASGARTAADPI